jgi:uncharacterized protein (TIGR04222 family)
VNDHADRLDDARREIQRRLVDRGFLATTDRFATFGLILRCLWLAPAIFAAWGMVDLSIQGRSDPVKGDGAIMFAIVLAVHLFILRVIFSSTAMQADRAHPWTRSGRRAVWRAQDAHRSIRPSRRVPLISLSPEDATLSLGLHGLKAWSEQDYALKQLFHRLFPPPPPSGDGGGGSG